MGIKISSLYKNLKCDTIYVMKQSFNNPFLRCEPRNAVAALMGQSPRD